MLSLALDTEIGQIHAQNPVTMRLDSNIESKSSNNTYLNIIEIFNKLFKKLNIIELRNLVVTST